jgi:CheY-like chemotaxis protein
MLNKEYDRPMELLLVEDNPADVHLVREGLREANVSHRLSVVADGQEAVEFLYGEGDYRNAPKPDLILLDLNLPRKLGLEVLATVKTDNRLKYIPVLIYSSSSDPSDVRAAYGSGANSYIRKPRQLEDIYDIVRTLEHFWFELALIPSMARI